MPTMTQLTGGAFQNCAGVPRANGYLTMQLSVSGTIAGVGSITEQKSVVPLDGNGNVLASPPQQVWANDVIYPRTYYTVTVYSAKGQQCWGPHVQQVTSGGVGGGTFDLSQWVPDTITS